MSIVYESIGHFPFETPPLRLQRDEALLLADPLPSNKKRHRDHPPIGAVHFPTRYVQQAFSHPRDVYKSEFARIEWQTMHDSRQAFYHRNTGADEISYEVCGRRYVLTDLGTAVVESGDFVRLPNGVAHDNYGLEDIHVLFYLPEPAAEQLEPSGTSEHLQVPFDGWLAGQVNELVSERLGGPGTDIVLFPADERLLLDHAQHHPERLQIVRPADDARGTTWVYRSANFMIGVSREARSDGREYRRHLNADEVHYQLHGHRTLVTQRGTIHLEPGDFVRIPRGVAFTSIHDAFSEHLTLISTYELQQVPESAKQGERIDADTLARMRG
ncbi:hypothetical protein DF142_31730 [Burkholderia cenocepacia]|uniref:hypothetical protein n=1 Tax=Burkholderia cenocepacia TaxID=95486 RepID=UPI000F5644F5|nr:hypothetical protein [Burkholderia cenocepacia]RQU32813.1 hypothetical protein DF142_31730 [Burkholderia cenocepacia]RQU55186.1 hypothetical protein DF140_34910 [Burkholderia cenocepacia]